MDRPQMLSVGSSAFGLAELGGLLLHYKGIYLTVTRMDVKPDTEVGNE